MMCHCGKHRMNLRARWRLFWHNIRIWMSCPHGQEKKYLGCCTECFLPSSAVTKARNLVLANAQAVVDRAKLEGGPFKGTSYTPIQWAGMTVYHLEENLKALKKLTE